MAEGVGKTEKAPIVSAAEVSPALSNQGISEKNGVVVSSLHFIYLPIHDS